jgi:hypothetical protein
MAEDKGKYDHQADPSRDDGHKEEYDQDINQRKKEIYRQSAAQKKVKEGVPLVCGGRMLPVGAGLSEKCVQLIEKHCADHHPAKPPDNPVGCGLEKRHERVVLQFEISLAPAACYTSNL